MDMDVSEVYFLDTRWNISFSILVCVREQRKTTIPEYDMLLLLVEINQFVCGYSGTSMAENSSLSPLASLFPPRVLLIPHARRGLKSCSP